MFAEKMIVAQWLRNQGFLAVRPLYAKSARELGHLAVLFRNGLVDQVWHVETICWVSSAPEPKTLIKDAKKRRFESKAVKKIIEKELKQLGINDLEQKKVLVVGEFSQKKQAEDLAEKEGVQLVHFSQVMKEVLEQLDTHYYRDDCLRTLQFLKFVSARNPEQLAQLLFGERGIVSAPTRKQFVKVLIESHLLDHELAKADMEVLRPLLSKKKISDVEALAKLIEETLLNKKTRKPFVEALAKRKATKPLVKKDQTLGSFIE